MRANVKKFGLALTTLVLLAAMLVLAAGTAVAGEITAGDFPDRSRGLLTWMNVEGFEDRVIGTHTLSGFDITIDGTYDGVPIVGGEHKSEMYMFGMWFPADWQPGFASDDTYTSTAPEDIPGENSLAYVFYVTQTHGEDNVYIIEVLIKFKNGIRMRHTSRVTLPDVASFGSADLITTTDGLGGLEIREHNMSDDHSCHEVLNFGAGDSHGYLSSDLTTFSYFFLVLPSSSRFITDSQGFRVEALTIGVPPSEVWVDDDYTEGSCGGHTWGYDAFDNIQNGVDGVAAGGTVNVAAGTYSENVTINKSLTLKAGSNPAIDPGGGTAVTINASNVTITGFTIQNAVTGILATSGTGNVIHFCNIVNNTTWGLNNASGSLVDAENNWWGDASGPNDPDGTVEVPPCTDDPANEKNEDGAGNKVSDNVDYCPWAGAETKTETISGSGTMEGTSTGGDITIDATGDHTISTSTYASNPGGGHTFVATGYYDVHLDDVTGVVSLTIEFCPATEDTVIYYWNGTAWVACSNQVFNPGTGCVVVTITAATQPDLDYLTGGPFAKGYTPEPVGGTIVPVNKLELLAPWMGLAALASLAALTAALIRRRRRA